MATRRPTSVLRRGAGRLSTVLPLLALVLASAVVAPQVSFAEPGRKVREAQARVDALNEQAEAATERYLTTRYKVRQTRQDLARTQRQLRDQQSRVDTLGQAMADYAAAMYTSGGLDPTLQMILAPDPVQFLARAGALDQVARTQDAALRAAQTARQELAVTTAAVDQKLAALRNLRAQAAQQKRLLDDKLAQAKQVVAQLKQQQRQRLLALQRQRNQRAQAQSTASIAALPQPSPGSAAGSASGRASAAVAYALAQVGKSYVFGAAGPSAFDCSGLTMMAWAQAGVSLVHSATVQYDQTTRVAQSDIQPGDLVFFYSPIQHNGIYVGGGKFVHAANPEEGVRVDSLFSSYWQSVLVGIGRV